MLIYIRKNTGVRVACIHILVLSLISLCFFLIIQQFDPSFFLTKKTNNGLIVYSSFFILSQGVVVMLLINFSINKKLQQLTSSVQKIDEGHFHTEALKYESALADQSKTIERMHRELNEALELSVRDELTGVYNRRHFQQMLNIEIKRAERAQRNVSLLMIDVDRFKQFNDTYGHVKGDELLTRLTVLLQSHLREGDLLARYGGEEFVVMLTDATLRDATKVAEKLKLLVQSELRIDISDRRFCRIGRTQITVSVGVSSYPLCAANQKGLIETADIAMYQAKRDGRNLCRCYQAVDDELPLMSSITK